LGILDQILYDPFPAIIGHGHPIDRHLAVALKKRLGLRFPDKDEIALFGGQHNLKRSRCCRRGKAKMAFVLATELSRAA
jgi:hypothetical protein